MFAMLKVLAFLSALSKPAAVSLFVLLPTICLAFPNCHSTVSIFIVRGFIFLLFLMQNILITVTWPSNNDLLQSQVSSAKKYILDAFTEYCTAKSIQLDCLRNLRRSNIVAMGAIQAELLFLPLPPLIEGKFTLGLCLATQTIALLCFYLRRGACILLNSANRKALLPKILHLAALALRCCQLSNDNSAQESCFGCFGLALVKNLKGAFVSIPLCRERERSTYKGPSI